MLKRVVLIVFKMCRFFQLNLYFSYIGLVILRGNVTGLGPAGEADGVLLHAKRLIGRHDVLFRIVNGDFRTADSGGFCR